MTHTPNTKRDDISPSDFKLLVYKVDQLQVGVNQLNAELKSMSYVHKDDYVDFKREIEQQMVTQDQLKPIKVFFYAMLTAMATTAVGAFAYFIPRGGA